MINCWHAWDMTSHSIWQGWEWHGKLQIWHNMNMFHRETHSDQVLWKKLFKCWKEKVKRMAPRQNMWSNTSIINAFTILGLFNICWPRCPNPTCCSKVRSIKVFIIASFILFIHKQIVLLNHWPSTNTLIVWKQWRTKRVSIAELLRHPQFAHSANMCRVKPDLETQGHYQKRVPCEVGSECKPASDYALHCGGGLTERKD